jgi:hypothetical protein
LLRGYPPTSLTHCPAGAPPPFKQGQNRPHISSIKPFLQYSFRIRGGYFETCKGQVHDTIYQSKLIGVRGNHPAYPCYKPVELQVSQQDYAWVFNADGPSKSLGEAVIEGRYTVLEDMCEQVSSMQQDAGLFYSQYPKTPI